MEYEQYLKDQLKLIQSITVKDTHRNSIDRYSHLLSNLLNELDLLKQSEIKYIVNRTSSFGGYITYDSALGAVHLMIGVGDGSAINGLRAHEFHHAFQFEIGELSIRIDGEVPTLYDINDELESYNIERAIMMGIQFFEYPKVQFNGFPLKLDKNDVKNIYGGVYKNLPSERKKLNRSTRSIINSINIKNDSPVEFYKGMYVDICSPVFCYCSGILLMATNANRIFMVVEILQYVYTVIHYRG